MKEQFRREMDPATWSKNFQKTHDHPPRVLHIGNVANNAYQNAKILNGLGFDCDVLCNDYYHIMGCPEWDDAEFDENVEDQFFPAWNRMDLKGFERPKWFVQSRFDLCCHYLLAKCSGNQRRAAFWWRMCEFYRIHQNDAWLKLAIHLFQRARCIAARYIPYAKTFFKSILVNPKDCIQKTYKVLTGQAKEKIQKPAEDPVLRKFQDELDRLYPEYTRKLTEPARWYIASGEDWKQLLACYDVIFAYGTSAIYPYVAGCKNYIAYEHGTIRDIPYQKDDMGSLTLLAYGNAAVIYSTNIDCFESAQYIARPLHVPIVSGMHGIDVERISSKIQASSTLDDIVDTGDCTVFYAPSRMDFAVKGNDLMLGAAARLAAEGAEFRLVCSNWGNDVSKARALIDAAPELKKHVVWTEPLNRAQYYAVLSKVDAVLDQFILPAFGAIAIETLCANNPALITREYLPGMVERYCGSAMPYFPCKSEEDIYRAMKEIVDQSPRSMEIRRSGAAWVRQYHSQAKIAEKLLQAITAMQKTDTSPHS